MATIQDVTRVANGLRYRGEVFPGFNKPKRAAGSGKHKMVVLAKKGDQVKVVRFGHKDYEDFRQHGDEKRRKNYCARSGGIKGKADKFSANYWARSALWSC